MKTFIPFFLLFTLLVCNSKSVSAQYCDEIQASAGFPSDPECEAAICAYDSFCCTEIWDPICATNASAEPACSGCLMGNDNSMVSGIVFIDSNCNGTMDFGEDPVDGIDITSSSIVLATSGTDGSFSFTLPPNGEYNITAENIPGAISTSVIPISTPDSANTYASTEIGICPDVNYYDVSAYFYPDQDNIEFDFLPGDELTYFIHIYNHSFVAVDANLRYTFDSAGLNVTQFDGGVLEDNQITWEVINLEPLTSQTYVINLIILQEAEIGETYALNASAELSAAFPADANPLNDEQGINVNIGAPFSDFSEGCNNAQITPGFPGFPECEAVVCAMDSWCCSTSWDAICANLASEMTECTPCFQNANSSVIEGIVYIDYNCNGTIDGNDFGLSGHTVESSVSGTIATTNEVGIFSGYLYHLNAHDISPEALPGVTLPDPVTIVTPDTSNIYSGLEFSMCPIADYQDVAVDLSAVSSSGSSLFPAEEFSLQLCVENMGPWDSEGVLTLNLNDSVFFVVNADSGVSSEDQLIWSINLNPFETICYDLEVVVLAGAEVGTTSDLIADFELDSTLPSDQDSSNNQDSQQISIETPLGIIVYCDQPQADPGFPTDEACQSAICAFDPFCCNISWDAICASSASNEPACHNCWYMANSSVVTGKTFFDSNCDGIFNGGDIAAPNIPIRKDGQLIAVSNAIGEYSGLIESDQNVLLSVDPVTGFTIDSHNVFSEENETIHGLDFTFCSTGEVLNLAVTVSPVGLPPRPGFPVEYEVCVQNLSTIAGEASVHFDFDNLPNASVIDPEGGTITGTTITWNNIALEIFESHCFQVVMQVAVGTPPGTIMNPIVSVDALPDPAADIDLSNNTHSFSHEVLAAYDPNDKTVDKSVVNYTEMEDGEGVELSYVIRFQNTGNFFATNVSVVDALPDLLDINTLETISASHDYELVFLPGNTVEWVFENIMLPDSTSDEPGSHGQIHFRISTIPDVNLEDVIENSASIYFDFKDPVITEPAVTTFIDCSEGSLSIISPEIICEGDPFELSSNRSDFNNYSWTVNGQELSGEEISSTFLEDEINAQLTATNAVCTLSAEIQLAVSPQPFVPINPEGFTVCGVGEELAIGAVGTLNWYLDDELVATGDPVVLPESGNYTIVAENECGMVDITTSVQIVDIPDEVTITFDGEQLIVFPEGSDYVWLLNGFPVSTDGPAFTPTDAGDYSVIVYFEESVCSLTSNEINVPVAVNENLAAQIQLFPNPVNSITTLTLPVGEWNVSLMDASGKVIEQFGQVISTQFNIDVSSLSGGIYFVKVESTDASAVKKLMVE